MPETVLMSYCNHEFESEVIATDDGFELRWGDYVANEWVERYADLPVAVARLALLIDVVQHEDTFRDDPETFATNARSWLRLRGNSVWTNPATRPR